MTNADTIIAALRSGHDGLAAVVPDLTADDLARTSGAADWDVSQVLSHLGSGAEISRATLRATLDGEPHPGGDFNQAVWARWDAMSCQERADGFVASNQAMTELFESLDPATRSELRIDMGFLPAPVDVATAAGLRLNELALHSWDVRVTFDDASTLDPAATAALLPGPTMLIGWIAKSDQLGGLAATVAITTSDPDSGFRLRLGEQVSIAPATNGGTDGTLVIPAEAWLRLVTGRLAPHYTPEGIVTTGPADLDLLRKVFPGF